MTCSIASKKIDLETFSNGDFDKYDKFVKQKFYDEFINSTVYRNGRRITAGQTDAEREECYNHLTTKGSMDSSVRLPDLRRYESLFILKDILTNNTCNNCDEYLVWEKKEKYVKEKIFCVSTGYLIILAKRNKVYKFVSAYQIDSVSKKEKLVSEWLKYKK